MSLLNGNGTADYPVRMTRQMRRVEALVGEPVREYLRRAYYEDGLSLQEIADTIEVPRGTLGNWMQRFHLTKFALAQRAVARDAEAAAS